MLLTAAVVGAQTPQLLKRTTFKNDKFDFGAGGTVVVSGAPNGSIKIEGTRKNEIEIAAEIEVQAATEADLAVLSQLTTFTLDETPLRTSITSVGTNDKKALGKDAKKIPKNLFGLPFKIDYVIKVPHYCDLEIDIGKGDLNVSGVEGAIHINGVETNANVSLIGGGGLSATFQKGSIDVVTPNRSWTGGPIDVALNSGTMSVHLPWNLSGELEAQILRTGQIENGLTELKPRDRHEPFTEKQVATKASGGGNPLKFTVGDGTLKLIPITKP